MVWEVEISETAEKQITRLDPTMRTRMMGFLRKNVAGDGNPRDFGQSLKGELAGLWRYRVGDYRLICHIQDEIVTVLVLEVGHRREVYR